MTERSPTPTKPDHLNDTAYIAWALVQAFRLFITLAGKRWPDIRGVRQ